MAPQHFTAFRVFETGQDRFERKIEQLPVSSLPKGDLLVRVHYSSLNYKDALSAFGNRGVTRTFPHTPGIDAAGIVEKSNTGSFPIGSRVIVTSYDLGMNTPGGFGQYIRVPAGWAVPLPQGITLKQSMIFGTAGLTAAMSVDRLTHAIGPDKGNILVTGATGGVGSMAVAILSHLGYRITAVSGKSDTRLLSVLGASDIIERHTFLENTASPLLKAGWAGAVDTVGGELLATAIKGTDLDGVVTCCGNAASADLPITVFPFILRGISLLGIDSQHFPMEKRAGLWQKLANQWKFEQLDDMAEEITLDMLDEKIKKILDGGLQGRTLVNLGT